MSNAAVALFGLSFCYLVEGGASLPLVNGSDMPDSGGYHLHKERSKKVLEIMENCTLSAKFTEEKENIADLVAEGNTHIKVTIAISGDNGPLSRNYAGYIFRPYNWIIVTSVTGNRMLMLKEFFVEMTIQAFGQGVVTTDLTLAQNPLNCLKNKTQAEVENNLRRSFLKNFHSDGTPLYEEAEVCNRHVQEIDGEGQVVYVCCIENARKQLECSEVQRSTLMKALFYFISAVEWLTVSCFPLFIPYSVYKARSVFRRYIFQTGQDEKITFKLQKVSKLSKYQSNNYVEAKVHSFTHMTKFKKQIQDKVTELNTTYKVNVKEVLFTVRNSNIIARGRAPVSVLSFLNSFFVKCKLRQVIPSANDCCGANILKCLTHDCCSTSKCTWFQCLRYPMELIRLVTCFLPLLVRLLFYFSYEREFVRDQVELMEKRELNLHIEAIERIEYPLTNILSTDQFYIVIICYSTVPIMWIVYKLFPNDLKENIKFTFRKSVREMRMTKKSKICSYYIGQSLRPLKNCGICGIFAFPFYFLFLCIPLALEIIPICNFIVRLVKNFNLKDEEQIHTPEKKVKLVARVISNVVIVWMLLLLLVLIRECISFYVELIIYILVGFILNPGVSLRYVSMIVLIAVYGNECFSGVYNRYLSYNNLINSKVSEKVGGKLEDIASLPETEQDNMVFSVPPAKQRLEPKDKCRPFQTKPKTDERTLFQIVSNQCGCNFQPGFDKYAVKTKMKNLEIKETMFECGSEGFLKIRVPRLILFLDTSDMVYIPKSFLFKMANLPHDFCPGPVHLLYLKAMTDFFLIIIFLAFVFIVIFAFGQIQDISTGGQTLAALGSGLLPLFLRKFLFRPHDFPNVDNSDLQWRYMFENAIQKYSEKWNFVDLCVELDPALDGSTGLDNDISRGATVDSDENGAETSGQRETEDIAIDERQSLLENLELITTESESDELQTDLIIVDNDTADASSLNWKWFVPRNSDFVQTSRNVKNEEEAETSV